MILNLNGKNITFYLDASIGENPLVLLTGDHKSGLVRFGGVHVDAARDDDDPDGSHVGREDKAFVVAMDHDHRAYGARTKTPGILEN